MAKSAGRGKASSSGPRCSISATAKYSGTKGWANAKNLPSRNQKGGHTIRRRKTISNEQRTNANNKDVRE